MRTKLFACRANAYLPLAKCKSSAISVREPAELSGSASHLIGASTMQGVSWVMQICQANEDYFEQTRFTMIELRLAHIK